MYYAWLCYRALALNILLNKTISMLALKLYLTYLEQPIDILLNQCRKTPHYLKIMLCSRFVSFFHSLQKSKQIAIRDYTN